MRRCNGAARRRWRDHADLPPALRPQFVHLELPARRARQRRGRAHRPGVRAVAPRRDADPRAGPDLKWTLETHVHADDVHRRAGRCASAPGSAHRAGRGRRRAAVPTGSLRDGEAVAVRRAAPAGARHAGRHQRRPEAMCSTTKSRVFSGVPPADPRLLADTAISSRASTGGAVPLGAHGVAPRLCFGNGFAIYEGSARQCTGRDPGGSSR